MKSFILFFISIILFSCSFSSLETEPISVNTIEDGQILKRGDYFNITFDKISDSVIVNPTSADVVITYIPSDLGELNVEPIEFSIDLNSYSDPKYKITTDFQEGLYSILVKVYENDSVVSQHSSEFIVYSGQLSGEVALIYPTKDLYTNSVVILESKITHDSSIDPYLVWKFEDKIIFEGFKSQGSDKIIWDIEDKFGFIDIDLELFPYKLTDSSISSDSNIDFSFVANPLYKTLISPDLLANYSSYMNFNGNYIDEKNKDLVPSVFNSKVPAYYDSFYGMLMDSSNGFEIDTSVIPRNQDEKLISFSIILDFMNLSNDNGNIFYTGADDINFSVVIKDGQLITNFYNDGKFSSSLIRSNVIIKEKNHFVASFIKEIVGYKVIFYLNGENKGSFLWGINNSDFIESNTAKTVIGSSSSLSGSNFIIDSLKVYTQDNKGLNNIYPDNLLDKNESSMTYVISEGFNSIYTPLNLEGDGYIDGEYLILGLDSKLSFFNKLKQLENYTLTIQTNLNSQYIIGLVNADGSSTLKNLKGSAVIKNISNKIYINNQILEDLSDLTGFYISNINNTVLDSITLTTLDRPR